MTKTQPNHYYGLTRDDRLVDLGRIADSPVPDVVVCRRVADYPNGQPPAGAGRGNCAKCGAAVAFNPNGPHQQQPRRCMQCAGIIPLPYDGPR